MWATAPNWATLNDKWDRERVSRVRRNKSSPAEGLPDWRSRRCYGLLGVQESVADRYRIVGR